MEAERSMDDLEATEENEELPDWIEWTGPDSLRLVLWTDPETEEEVWVEMKAMSAGRHFVLDKTMRQKKLSGREYMRIVLEVSISAWSLQEEGDDIGALPIPSAVPKSDRTRIVWDKVSQVFYNKMTIGGTMLEHPGGEASGGALAQALLKVAL